MKWKLKDKVYILDCGDNRVATIEIVPNKTHPYKVEVGSIICLKRTLAYAQNYAERYILKDMAAECKRIRRRRDILWNIMDKIEEGRINRRVLSRSTTKRR
jgi:hypothetical protein